MVLCLYGFLLGSRVLISYDVMESHVVETVNQESCHNRRVSDVMYMDIKP